MTDHGARHDALIQEMSERGLDGFLIPRADEYLNEYVPPHGQRLLWATGFTGSAGLAIAHRQGSAIFVDGRYTIQVHDEVQEEVFEPLSMDWDDIGAWLRERGGVLGYDPKLHTSAMISRLESKLEGTQIELRICADNPIDGLWRQRPAPPSSPMRPHPLRSAGEAHASKRTRLAAGLEDKNIDVAVLAMPESVAWLLNVRGDDVEHTPLSLSVALLHKDARVTLFLEPEKASDALREHLGEDVTICAPGELGAALAALHGQRVLLDPKRASIWFSHQLTTATVVEHMDPCVLPRARKNETEQAGARAAHRRDGTAMVRYLAWFDANAEAGLDELTSSDKLEAFRQETGELRDLSFDTISGAGPNGAIVHYRANPKTNRKLEPGSLYLLDSGAQYIDGTTDITRTMVVGEPTTAHRTHYTLVLKGHVSLSRARFPEGTTGHQLDILARHALWAAGLNFNHGTGHGVGSYLSVHEGPQGISTRSMGVALEPGMILSNEPGYYKTGAYGIRIENLIMVTPPTAIDGGEEDMLGFETLTLAPYDRRLIDTSMLSASERAWVDAYHAHVHEELGDTLTSPEERDWLDAATQPL